MKVNNQKLKDTYKNLCSLGITLFPATKGPFFTWNQIAKALGVHQDAWELWQDHSGGDLFWPFILRSTETKSR